MSLLNIGGQGARIIVPGKDDKGRPYGDMTVDVAIELAKMRAEENYLDWLKAADRQAHIVHTCGKEAPLLEHGQLVAQIDGAVFADWERREGKGFFGDKSTRRAFLKRHPECAVKGIPKNPTFRVADGSSITLDKGAPRRGGRWALK